MRAKEIITPLAEGIFDRFKKREPQMLPLTQEQRDFIKQFFSSHNADIKWGKDGSEYVLPHNVRAVHGQGVLHFRNEEGQLMVSVEHYRNKADRNNRQVSPLVHTDHVIAGAADMEKVKELVSEDASAGACSSSAVAAVSTPLGQPIKRVKKAQPKKDKK